MSILHGSEVKESPTQKVTPLQSAGVIPVVFGTAPVHLTNGIDNINVPIIAKSFQEFQQKLGYSEDWNTFTLCEAADYFFNVAEVGPIVFVNVLDPSVNKLPGSAQSLNVTNSKAKLGVDNVILTTLVLTASASTLVAGTDYIAQYDFEGKIDIAFLTPQTTVSAAFSVIDETSVTDSQLVGGYNESTSKTTGIELINKVVQRTGHIPGLILAPKYGKKPTIAAVLRSKAKGITGYFKAQALTDIDSSIVKKKSDLADYKEQNGYSSTNEITFWPLGGYKGKVYHLSLVAAATILKQMQFNNDFPSVSISNKSTFLDRILIDNGATYGELELSPNEANEVNELGVVTALNFLNGFTLWGNYTAAFPIEDVKDKFHNVRIMHNFLGNSIILNTWADVDGNINPRKLQAVVDKMNIWFNTLQGVGAIVGGRVVALPEENPQDKLLKGQTTIRYYVAESVPNEYIENVLEFDANYYNNLFN